jgi:hypothetical protein
MQFGGFEAVSDDCILLKRSQGDMFLYYLLAPVNASVE